MLYLRALGGLSLERDGQPVSGPAAQRRRLVLLTVLALSGNRGISRDRLIAFFWPESDASRARGALKQSLYAIRRDLGTPQLTLGGLELRLNPAAVGSDVGEFERALAAGDAERAVEIHAGSLLHGVYVSGLPELEHWLERERSRLDAQCRSALRTLALAADQRGDHQRAVGLWTRIVNSDPLSASAATGLIRALARGGDSAAALQYAQGYERLLHAELGAPPDAAVTHLVDAIKNGDRRLRELHSGPVTDPAMSTPTPTAPTTPNLTSGEEASALTGRTEGPRSSDVATVAPPALPAIPVLHAHRRLSRRRMTLLAAGSVAALALFATAWFQSHTGSDVESDRSIAVLPFANLSGDERNNIYGEGLAEELTVAVARAGLRVIGRGSARSLTEAGLDPAAIGRKLGVARVLQGTVLRVDQRLRISVSLISAADGATQWGETYDTDIRDVFATHDKIARQIAALLKVPTTANRPTLARRETADPESHALYLQGLYLWNRRNGPRLRQAIGFFEEALRRDPKYARAAGGLAMAYLLLPQHENVPTDAWLSKAMVTARTALALDSTLAAAHAVLGLAHAMRFENAEAVRSFETAVRQDSGFATTRHWYSQLLSHVGRFDEAMHQALQARILEPASLVIQVNVAQMAFNEGRLQMADSLLGEVHSIDSTFELARFVRGRVLIELGRVPDAIAELEWLARQPAVRPSNKLGVLAYAYARAGRDSVAWSTLQLVPSDTALAFSGDIAVALYALGDREAAVRVFRRAVAQHEHHITIAGRSAAYDGLRQDPSLGALIAEIESPTTSRR